MRRGLFLLTFVLVLLPVLGAGCFGALAEGGHARLDIGDLLRPKQVEPADLPDTLNVLVVGTDRRRGSSVMHCDAIQMVHLDTKNETAQIVNVPRGTITPIAMPEDWYPEVWPPKGVPNPQIVLPDPPKDVSVPEAEAVDPNVAVAPTVYVLSDQGEGVLPGDVAVPEGSTVLYESNQERLRRLRHAAWGQEQYLANVCEFIGVDAFVERVEAITGYQADYRVLVGFSQAQSILQALSFDPVTTLQFLRHRQSYGIGDHQRSFNQAVFLRDLMTTRADDALEVPYALQFALYQLVETDMPLPVAYALVQWLAGSAIQEDASRVTHRTAPPGPSPQEMHFDVASGEELVQELYAHLARIQRGFEVSDIQPALRAYHHQHLQDSYRALVAGDVPMARQELDAIVDVESWRQVGDRDERHTLMAQIAVLESTLAWAETRDVEATLYWPRILRALIEAEDGQSERLRRIDDHLDTLLAPRLSLDPS